MELRYRKENRFPANSAMLIRRREAHSGPLHAHDFFELEIVVEGTGKQILNGKERTGQPPAAETADSSQYGFIIPNHHYTAVIPVLHGFVVFYSVIRIDGVGNDLLLQGNSLQYVL